MTELQIKIARQAAKNKWSVIAQGQGCGPVLDEVRLTDSTARAAFVDQLLGRMPGLDRDVVITKLEELAAQVLTEAVDAPGETGDGDMAKAAYLAGLAFAAFDLVVSEEGQGYAIPKEGVRVATLISASPDGLGGWFGRALWKAKRDVASTSTVQNAVHLVEAFANEQPKQKVHRRVAWHGGAVVLDLADEQGRCVVVDANGWRVEDEAPVVFVRNRLRGPLPVPEKGGQLEQLDELVNFSPEHRDLAVGWLLSSLMPGASTPIGLLGGQQGTGKTTAAKSMCLLVDPTPAPVRGMPKDAENWSVTAQASWVIVLDNISTIAPWFSDALCKAATGEAMVRRTLYSDSGVSVFTVHNPVLLTSIDPGDLRGDLLDRICYFDLEPIEPRRRRRDAELKERFEVLRAKILGALLDLLVEVLRVQASVQVENSPRLADFAHLLACIDTVRGTQTLKAFADQRVRAARDAAESSVLGQLLVPWVESLGGGRWSGTAGELLELLKKRSNGSIEGIRSARKLSGELRRLSPSLQAIGIGVTPPTEATRGGDPRRKRTYLVETLPLDIVHTVHIVQTDQAVSERAEENPSILDEVDGVDDVVDVASTSDFEGGSDSSESDRAAPEADAEAQQ